MSINNTQRGLSILYVAVFLLALNGLFAKSIPLDAVSITQIRSFLAALVLGAVLCLRRAPVGLCGARQYLGVYGLGVLLSLHWVSFFHAMQVSTVAVGMLAMFSYPMITVLIEPFFKGQRPAWGDVFAGLLVVLGVLLMVGEDLGFHQLNQQSAYLQGAIWGVVSALLFAVRNVTQKYCFSQVSSDSLIFHQVIASALILLVFVDLPGLQDFAAGDWLTLLLLGVVSTAAAHTLLSFSLKRLDAKTVAMVSCLQPLLAALMAWLVLAEQPTLNVALGGGVILSVALYESWRQSRLARQRLALSD